MKCVICEKIIDVKGIDPRNQNCVYNHLTINADLYKIYQNPLFNDIFILNLDIIFDLIQAGLVEKAEE